MKESYIKEIKRYLVLIAAHTQPVDKANVCMEMFDYIVEQRQVLEEPTMARFKMVVRQKLEEFRNDANQRLFLPPNYVDNMIVRIFGE